MRLKDTIMHVQVLFHSLLVTAWTSHDPGYLCCDGTRRDTTTDDECCGTGTYASSDSMCCNDRVVSTVLFDACCGTIPYHTTPGEPPAAAAMLYTLGTMPADVVVSGTISDGRSAAATAFDGSTSTWTHVAARLAYCTVQPTTYAATDTFNSSSSS